LPAKAPRKTIKSNPLDRIVIKSTAVTSKKVAPKKVVATKATKKIAVKSQATRSKTLINKGRKNMPNENNVNTDQIDPKLASADQILAAEFDGTSTHSGEDTVVIDYRHQLAKTTITNASQWATAAGFIPVTGLDTVTISGVQLKMVYDLCEIYKVPFKKEAVLAIVGAALGGSFTTIISTKVASFGLSKIPYIGSVVSLISQPAISFATTYAIGLLFIKHFENKGDLLNFDLESTKAVFDREFEKAKAVYNQQLKNAKSVYATQIAKAKKMFSKKIATEAAESSAATV
jgi:uncharacterized protein (DUF697 family)